MAIVNRFKVGSATLAAEGSVSTRWLNTPRDIVCIIDCTIFSGDITRQASVELIRVGNHDAVGFGVNREFFWEFKNTSGVPCSIDMWMAQII
jgi:hypothetical protein